MMPLPKPLKHIVDVRQRIHRRLPKRKKMTIGIGMLCNDGIVIAADTREVWANIGKRHNDKVRVHGFKGLLTYVVVSAGDGDLMEMFLDDLHDKVWAAADNALNSKDEFVDVAEIARAAAQELFNRHIAPFASFPQNERPEHYALLGVQYHEALYGSLYRVAPPATLISIKGDLGARPHAAIGLGWIMADPLLKQFHSVQMDVETTADLAVYILKHVKDGVQDCDGYSDVVLQRNNGAVEVLNRDYVQALEKWFEDIDVVFSDVLQRANHSLMINPMVDNMNHIIASKPKQLRYNGFAE